MSSLTRKDALRLSIDHYNSLIYSTKAGIDMRKSLNQYSVPASWSQSGSFVQSIDNFFNRELIKLTIIVNTVAHQASTVLCNNS